jgi:hypothetical protein
MVVRAQLVAGVVVCLLVGCTVSPATSPTPGASPTGTTQGSPTATSATPTAPSTPTPTTSWSPAQAAALQAVEDFRAASRAIGTNPASFTRAEMRSLLSKSSGGNVLTTTVRTYVGWKQKGFHYDGAVYDMSTSVTPEADVEYAIEVIVTKCHDQRGSRVVDKTGSEVGEAQLGYAIPDFNLRQYVVQKRTGEDRFLVQGLALAEGECGP